MPRYRKQIVRLQKIGDVWGVVIPPVFVKLLGLTDNTRYSLTVRDGKIYVALRQPHKIEKRKS